MNTITSEHFADISHGLYTEFNAMSAGLGSDLDTAALVPEFVRHYGRRVLPSDVVRELGARELSNWLAYVEDSAAER